MNYGAIRIEPIRPEETLERHSTYRWLVLLAFSANAAASSALFVDFSSAVPQAEILFWNSTADEKAATLEWQYSLSYFVCAAFIPIAGKIGYRIAFRML
jgi:hypothetical protein